MAFVANNTTLISSLSFFQIFKSVLQSTARKATTGRTWTPFFRTRYRHPPTITWFRTARMVDLPPCPPYAVHFHFSWITKTPAACRQGKVPEGIIKNGQDVLQKYRMAYTAFGSFFYPRWEDRIAAVRWSRGQNSRQRLVRQKIATQKFK